MGGLVRIFTLGALVATAGFVTESHAATYSVPGTHTTIGDAVTSATAGDTIEITNSAVYDERVTLSEPITLIAVAGANPTITKLRTLNGASGAQIGSNSGGRITIAGPEGHVVELDHEDPSTSPPVSFENVRIAATEELTYMVRIRQGGNTDFTNVEFDGLGHAGRGIWFAPDPITSNDVTYNFTDCLIHGMTGFTIWGYNNDRDEGNVEYTVNLTNCEVRGSVDSSLDALYFNRNAVVTLNVDESSIIAGPGGALYIDAGNLNNTVSITNTAMLMNQGQGQIIDIDDITTGFNMTVDHSDFVALNNETVINIELGGDNRNVTVTNSNLISDTGLVFDHPSTDSNDVIISDYNNAYSTTDSMYTNVSPGANDLSEIPGYADPEGLDFSYTNAAVLVGDDSNGPIGINSKSVPVELSTFQLQ